MFRKYEKVHRLGKEETDGILKGLCYIQEKIDGANTQIWFSDGWIKCGSRSKEVTEGFNGFVEYANKHEGIKACLAINPKWTLYGEWLVRHTLAYNELAYKNFYLFDIFDGEKFLALPEVYEVAKEFNMKTPELFATLQDPKVEDVKAFVGKSVIGAKGEGVVIKNFEFINTFGEKAYAKIVTEEFKEDNAVTFGGNNKYSDTYWEVFVVNKYMTLARVQKIMNKLEPELNERFDMKHIPRIINTAYHDMVTEEIWEIQSKVKVLDFGTLKRVATKKARQIYIDVINDNISVADREN